MENETQFYYATEDTYAIAAELSEQGFEEVENIYSYDECDAVFITAISKKFKFTTENAIGKTDKFINTQKINLKTVEEWKTN